MLNFVDTKITESKKKIEALKRKEAESENKIEILERKVTILEGKKVYRNGVAAEEKLMAFELWRTICMYLKK